MQSYSFDGQPNQGYASDGQHQQHQQHQTVVVVSQPQSQFAIVGQPQNIRQWTTGICGCFEECCGCLYCTFCHPCFMCTLATQMDECCCGPFCLGGVFETAMRTKLRAQFGIQGSVLCDVCTMMWCNPCGSHQMYREIRNLGYKP